MASSALILLLFIAGVVSGRLGLVPEYVNQPDFTQGALFIFMFIVGIGIGISRDIGTFFRNNGSRLLFLPLATTLGTFGGAALVAIFLPLTLWECLAIGSGFGYYSLSSIFIGQYKGAELGTIALLCNILRELITIVFMPILARKCGPLAAIASGGATTMDTTLPVIARYAGQQWTMPAIFHAMILDVSVPFWVTFFCAL